MTFVAAFPGNLAGVSAGHDWILLHSNDDAGCDDVPEQRGVLRLCYTLGPRL